MAAFQPINEIDLNPQRWSDIEELEGARPDWDFYPISHSKILMAFNIMHAADDRVIKYYQLDNEGSIVSDKILEQKDVKITAIKSDGAAFSLILPSSRKTLLSVSSEERLYSAWTEEFVIKVYDTNGEYKRAFYYPYSKSILNPDDIINNYSESPFRKGIKQIDFTETWPALNTMHIDNKNRLWISTIVENQKIYQWWVLDNQGTLLAKFDWPRAKAVEVVKTGSIYTIEENANGVEQVVRYRIDMKPV